MENLWTVVSSWAANLSVSDWVGFVAGAGTTISFVPQVMKVLKTGDTTAISLGMYVLFTTGVSLWLAYGFLIHELPVIIPNLLTLVLAGTVLGMKIRDTLRGRG